MWPTSSKRVVAYSVRAYPSRNGRNAIEGIPNPSSIQRQPSYSPLCGDLGKKQPKGCTARIYFTSSYLITRFRHWLFNDGNVPAVVGISKGFKTENYVLRRKSQVCKSLKTPVGAKTGIYPENYFESENFNLIPYHTWAKSSKLFRPCNYSVPYCTIRDTLLVRGADGTGPVPC